MTRLMRLALLADGSSDRALLPIIRWVVAQADPEIEILQPGFRVRDMRSDLLHEMAATCQEFEPDILFVHRDAEAQDPELRRQEIPDVDRTLVRVVPVRMTEAWLLFDADAIRSAAGNPMSSASLVLPLLKRVEALPDPKSTLHEMLLSAAEVTGRRLKRFQRDLPASVHRVAELIRDFAPLRRLSAFGRFERECREACREAAGGLRKPGEG